MNYYQLPPELKQAIADTLPVIARTQEMTDTQLVDTVNKILRASYYAPLLETPPTKG